MAFGLPFASDGTRSARESTVVVLDLFTRRVFDRDSLVVGEEWLVFPPDRHFPGEDYARALHCPERCTLLAGYGNGTLNQGGASGPACRRVSRAPSVRRCVARSGWCLGSPARRATPRPVQGGLCDHEEQHDEDGEGGNEKEAGSDIGPHAFHQSDKLSHL